MMLLRLFFTISQKGKRSMKLPDPPVFSDEKKPNIVLEL